MPGGQGKRQLNFSPTGPGSHRPDGPEANHALTFNLGHSSEAAQGDRRLPEAVVPAHIVTLGTFQLTPNANVDRNASSDPAPSRPPVVGMGGDRAPIWPKGLTGSLSHRETTCIAAVGRAGSVRAIGVDVQEDTALDADLIPIVCSLAERGWLSSLSPKHQGRMAKLIFRAKECVCKCQYILSHRLFGFDTFDITPDPDTGQFEAIFVRDVPPFSAGTHLPGRFAMDYGLIVTAMTLGA